MSQHLVSKTVDNSENIEPPIECSSQQIIQAKPSGFHSVNHLAVWSRKQLWKTLMFQKISRKWLSEPSANSQEFVEKTQDSQALTTIQLLTNHTEGRDDYRRYYC